MKGRKVYEVGSGEYSDYFILGIFTSKKKAESYIEKYNEQVRCNSRYARLTGTHILNNGKEYI